MTDRNSLQIKLSARVFFNVETDPLRPQRMKFSKGNLEDLSTHLKNKLDLSVGVGRVLLVDENSWVTINDSVVQSQVYKIRRSRNEFGESFPRIVDQLADELAAACKAGANFWLEVGFDDTPTATENKFSDYLYIFARLIPR